MSGISWYPETIAGATERTLRMLGPHVVASGFYLAGGTALALRFGHRHSVDLDFFSSVLFDEEALIQQVQTFPEFSLTSKAPHTVHCTIGGTKVSFLGYPYPTLFPPASFLGVPVADPREISCMKISAAASRGTRRDFVDLYFASLQFGMAEILMWFSQKYAQTNFNRPHILKALTYFEDAEKDPLPAMFVPLDWAEVKRYFGKEIQRLA